MDCDTGDDRPFPDGWVFLKQSISFVCLVFFVVPRFGMNHERWMLRLRPYLPK